MYDDVIDYRLRRRKKNTKNWCRGKIGVPHDNYWRVAHTFPCVIYWQEVCVKCGKQFQYFIERTGGFDQPYLRPPQPTK